MLNKTELMLLERALADQRVLSVYVDGTEADPAAQAKWRLDLAHSIQRLRTSLSGASHEDRMEFDRCVESLARELATLPGSVGAPGWMAFVTADGLQHAERLPVQEATIAMWTKGPAVAPYIAALKELRPVVLVVADARKGRIHLYRAGTLTATKTAHARAHPGDHPHMGGPARPGLHAGTRGTTGHEAAPMALLTGVQRMVGELAEQALELAGPDGFIVIGGIPRVAARLSAALEHAARNRVTVLESLDIHASPAALAAAAHEGASTLRDAEDLARIREIEEVAPGAMLGSIGPVATREALDSHRVRELYLTQRFIEEHIVDAETAVRLALDQGAAVEAVSRAAAERLNGLGGMSARLRYPLMRDGAGTSQGRAG